MPTTCVYGHYVDGHNEAWDAVGMTDGGQALREREVECAALTRAVTATARGQGACCLW